jgi:uncharacterized surface protein with fasciclin (FAS1) repeats
MNRIRPLYFVFLLIQIVIGCNKDFETDGKYSRPDWLAGKLYTQIREQADLTVFAKCIQLTGYDSIIDKSGSYTVFAPNDEAFSLYFQEHPEYGSVESMPREELVRLVKYLIVQNPWSTEQLRSLDVYGWIDSTDLNNDIPRGFKRETLLREKDRNYGVAQGEKKSLIIVDTLKSSWLRKQATDSRKYVPIFYKEYLDIYKLTSADYAFFFDRPFDKASDLYFAGAKIVTPDIFAENGFVHVIDRVVEPLENAFQILNSTAEGHSYSKFLALINTFPEFAYNEDKTLDQPGADQGLVVDSLFDITYPELAFDITNEKTKPPSGVMGLPSNVSIRYHHGLIAPTNEAFDAFENEYLKGPGKWGSMQDAPHHIKRMIVNTHMSTYPVYPSSMTTGFRNGEDDIIAMNLNDVVQKQFGSNCTFVGVDRMIVPRAFTSVTGPIYTEKGFQRSMYAIEASGLLPALKREGMDYMLFVEPDANMAIDSSLIYNDYKKEFSAYLLTETSAQKVPLTTNDLRTLILNHIGTGSPRHVARKEFIKNLAGNYIIFNNVTNEVSGLSPTTVGYKGLEKIAVIPEQISTGADNGTTFQIDNWFNFSAPTLFLKISGSYPAFHALLKKAGLTKDKEYRYSFISDNEDYTVFVPSDAALAAYNTDTLTTEELKSFLLLHFVQGGVIFTDGTRESGYYETARVDEKSTTYTTVYTKIHLNPGVDFIDVTSKQGGDPYVSVVESPKTNIITARNLGTGDEAFPVIISNAVIHEIDKVLLMNQVETK